MLNFHRKTIGTKPQAQAVMMAVQYGYRIKHNTSIACAEHHNKKNGTATRRNYYHLFYTSHLTSYIQMKDEPPAFQHPRDLLEAMKFAFVDFCLEEKECRTIPDIWKSELKFYGEVVTLSQRQAQDQPDERIPLPIPDKVGISYLERVEQRSVTKGAYSQMKTNYTWEMQDALQAQDLM